MSYAITISDDEEDDVPGRVPRMDVRVPRVDPRSLHPVPRRETLPLPDYTPSITSTMPLSRARLDLLGSRSLNKARPQLPNAVMEILQNDYEKAQEEKEKEERRMRRTRKNYIAEIKALKVSPEDSNEPTKHERKSSTEDEPTVQKQTDTECPQKLRERKNKKHERSSSTERKSLSPSKRERNRKKKRKVRSRNNSRNSSKIRRERYLALKAAKESASQLPHITDHFSSYEEYEESLIGEAFAHESRPISRGASTIINESRRSSKISSIPFEESRRPSKESIVTSIDSRQFSQPSSVPLEESRRSSKISSIPFEESRRPSKESIVTFEESRQSSKTSTATFEDSYLSPKVSNATFEDSYLSSKLSSAKFEESRRPSKESIVTFEEFRQPSKESITSMATTLPDSETDIEIESEEDFLERWPEGAGPKPSAKRRQNPPKPKLCRLLPGQRAAEAADRKKKMLPQYGLETEDERLVRELFDELDPTASGFVKIKKLYHPLKREGIKISLYEMEQIGHYLGEDIDGPQKITISESEIHQFVINCRRRMQLHKDVCGMSLNNPAIIAMLYDEFDIEGDDALGETELYHVVRFLKIPINRKDVGILVKTIDLDDNGFIEPNELAHFLKSIATREELSSQILHCLERPNMNYNDFLTGLFNKFDVDGAGHLNTKQMTRLMEFLKLDFSPKSVDNLMMAMDEDKNGTIELPEFISFFGTVMHWTDMSSRCKKAEESSRNSKIIISILFIITLGGSIVLLHFGILQEAEALEQAEELRKIYEEETKYDSNVETRTFEPDSSGDLYITFGMLLVFLTVLFGLVLIGVKRLQRCFLYLKDNFSIKVAGFLIACTTGSTLILLLLQVSAEDFGIEELWVPLYALGGISIISMIVGACFVNYIRNANKKRQEIEFALLEAAEQLYNNQIKKKKKSVTGLQEVVVVSPRQEKRSNLHEAQRRRVYDLRRPKPHLLGGDVRGVTTFSVTKPTKPGKKGVHWW